MPAGSPLHYDQFGYFNFNDVIPGFMIDGMFDWYSDHRERFNWRSDDRPFDKTFTIDDTGLFNDAPFIEYTDYIQAILENYLGHRLHPTYNMGRVYNKGIKMEKHVDRAPCQVSITLPIAYRPMNWPINIDSKKGTREVQQHVGDMLLYKGCEVLHYRKENTIADIQYQHYFHFIDIDTEEGAYMYQFSDEHLLTPDFWPYSFTKMKQQGILPELTDQNKRK
jgi:hypothetical protein